MLFMACRLVTSGILHFITIPNSTIQTSFQLMNEVSDKKHAALKLIVHFLNTYMVVNGQK